MPCGGPLPEESGKRPVTAAAPPRGPGRARSPAGSPARPSPRCAARARRSARPGSGRGARRRSAAAARPPRPAPSRRRSRPRTAGSGRGRGRAGAAAAPRRSAGRPRARRAGRAPTARPPGGRSPPPATTRAPSGSRSALISARQRQALPDQRHQDHDEREEDHLGAAVDVVVIESAAASEIAPRMPHQPTTTRSRRPSPGATGSSANTTRTAITSAASSDADRRAACRPPSPTSLDHRVELQAEQDEQHRLQPEDHDLPEGGRGQAGVGVEVLRLVPAAVDAADGGGEDAGGVDLLGRDVARVGGERSSAGPRRSRRAGVRIAAG